MVSKNFCLVLCASLGVWACSDSAQPPAAADAAPVVNNVDAALADALPAGADAAPAPNGADAGPPSSGPCPAPYTLAYHLAQAPGGTTFSYTPPGLLVADITGSWHPGTGNFSWIVTYHPAHDPRRTEVAGTSTGIGDQATVHYTRATYFEDGSVKADEIEEDWLGCAVTRRTRPLGAADDAWWPHAGFFDGIDYTYTETKRSYYYTIIAEFEGVIHSDLSWFESAGDEDWDERHDGDADGYVHWFFESDSGDSSTTHLDEWAVDGAHHYLVNNSGDGDGCASYAWHEIFVDGAGFGSGQASICDYTLDPKYGTMYVCDVTIEPGTCTQSCTNGQTLTCTYQ